MIQELFSLDLTNEWRPKEVLQAKINELTESGWRVVSIIKIDSEHHILAEKERPPGVIFSFGTDITPEEIESMRKELVRQYEKGTMTPLMVMGDVKVQSVAGPQLQVFEVTREMLDSWFGVDPSVSAAKRLVSEIQHEINEGRMSVNDARRLLGMEPIKGVDKLV